jgi:hypothetical protein
MARGNGDGAQNGCMGFSFEWRHLFGRLWIVGLAFEDVEEI